MRSAIALAAEFRPAARRLWRSPGFAALGVWKFYGVVAAAVALRRKELAIRLALGARWTHVVHAAVGESAAAVAAGLVGGAVLVVVASRWSGGVLFETSPRDPVVLAQAAFFLLAVAAAAATVPALQALRTKPADLFRAE